MPQVPWVRTEAPSLSGRVTGGQIADLFVLHL